MKKIIIFAIFWILFVAVYIAYAEPITDTCYKFDGVMVCGKKEIPQIPEPKIIEIPKKEKEEIIVATYWSMDTEYSDQEICDAIYIIEGKEEARQPFGIETIECKTFEKCEQICLNTVRNNRGRYTEYGFKEHDTYLEFLASRYCPPNQENWLRMLKFYLEKNNEL
ncbi:MAG: hypothetical protein PVG65_04590 [Candidatus Thorarchaeota archaeon]|jgi:hypothetical protein